MFRLKEKKAKQNKWFHDFTVEVVELGQLDVDGGGDGEEEDAEAAAAGVQEPQQVCVRVQAAAGTVQYNTVQYSTV